MENELDKTYNLLFAGVGGQGSLLIAELTSLAAANFEFDVKQTEVHGVSQRGGSVETHVRFGAKVYSPVVTPGEADVVIGLEKLEALRFAHFADPDNGVIIVNEFEIVPSSVTGAEENYPHEVVEYLQGRGLQVISLPATQMAQDLGDGRMANVVLLGCLSTLLPIPKESWAKALQVRLPKRYLEGNRKAFAAGQKIVREKQIM